MLLDLRSFPALLVLALFLSPPEPLFAAQTTSRSASAPAGDAGPPVQPRVQFAQVGQTAGEGDGALTITVVRSAALPQPTTVHFSVAGSATPGDDYAIDSSPLSIPAGETTATILVVPVDDLLQETDEEIVVTLTAAVNGQLGPRLEHTLVLVDDDRLESDDFNRCGLDPMWAFVDPAGGATVATRGAGTEAAQLLVTVPAGTHDLYHGVFTVPRVTQVVPDEDFEMEVKFDSSVSGSVRDQGIVVLADEANWARFDFFSSGSTLRLFAATTVGGVSTLRHDAAIGSAATAPTWLRVRRDADVWTVYWSTNGVSFTTATSFSFPLNVAEAGVYAGNVGRTSTMVVDYVFSTDAPIVPEDGEPAGGPGYDLGVATEGGGSVLVDADQELYYCGDLVSLRAVPNEGWGFDRWEGDLSGSANPAVVAMTADRQVGAVFVPVPLTAAFASSSSKIGEAGGPVPIEVRLAYTALADVTVTYTVGGTASDPDDYSIDPSPLVIPAGQSSGEIVITPVDELVPDLGEDIVLTITGVSGAGLGERLEHIATLVDDDATVVVSDDFNRCALDPIWSLVDPVGDALMETRGPGTDDAQLVLTVPAGVHDVYGSTFTVPRVTQLVPDGDFAIEVRFDSLVSGSIQDQGVLVLQDESNWARFDFYSVDSTVRLLAATTVDDQTTPRLDTPLGAPTAPLWMRVVRTLDHWALSWSSNGVSFSQVVSFPFVLAPTEAGVYAGNLGPAHTMVVDYLFEASEPVVPEDGAVVGEIAHTLALGVTGQGSVAADPDQPFYYCDEPVLLTAQADPGWVFDHWEGDLAGSANPETVVLSADRSITAVFVLAASAARAAGRGVERRDRGR